MEYKFKTDVREYISAGTAGVAQRVDSETDIVNLEKKYNLVALTKNNVMPCSQNQF